MTYVHNNHTDVPVESRPGESHPGLRPHTTGMPRAGRPQWVILAESEPRVVPAPLIAWVVLAVASAVFVASAAAGIWLLVH